MNYINTIETKIKQYKPGEIIVARNLYRENLSFVPEATFFKVLERMTKKNKLSRISKGVYNIPKATRFGEIAPGEKEIINHYTGQKNKSGIIIGYYLYNKKNITTQISNTTELYSNLISEERKVFSNILIRHLNISIDEYTKNTIEAFEILQNYYNIEDLNLPAFKLYTEEIAKNYNDQVTKKVLSKMKYKKRTIAFLQAILNYFDVKNSLSIYLANTSVYKIPKMEEIYESA